ncbi:short-chain dehydrogenase [Philodulcilactobacillus myokoensis]|uniref:Short-chain dehydrogenase n=1 Tax=Philodulcilactobacillus myokoensis TaxID=2929573 RepID=A0A9W6AZZ4_9LACO|nr:NAD(P)-binding oxidoreductase [Philodulcilactobacillus myokoensis]GLB46457.1 short-chain dehydrogenase [Philodulcilactobacillus myokoensis]
MKVFVIGAHGHVGQILVNKLVSNGDEVVAGLRTKDEFAPYKKMEHVQPALFDLKEDKSKMMQTFKDSDADAIIFSAGSGGKTDDAQTVYIDLDGAIKSMDAAKIANVNRYVMVSAIGSDDRSFWNQMSQLMHVYYIAKHYADVYLKDSGLDYTIIRPTILTNDKGTEKIELNPTNVGKAKIPREDVANVLVNVLHDDHTICRDYNISGGDTKISDLF